MWRDPIVEEVRAIRTKYAAQFGQDIAAMVKDLKEQQEAEERPVVSLTPRPVSRPSDAA